MIDYAFHHAECAWRIVRGDETSLNDMDISADGFWRSFLAMAFAFPAIFFVWVSTAHDLLARGNPMGMVQLLVSQSIIEIIVFLLPLIALALVLPRIGLGPNYTALVIARNWITAVAWYGVAGVTLIDTLFLTEPASDVGLMTAVILYFGILAALIFMFVRVTRAALNNRTGLASLLVAVETVVLFILSDQLYRLFGLTFDGMIPA